MAALGGGRRVAARPTIGYKPRMSQRIRGFLCLVLLAASLGGCTKCGFFWDDWQPRACHSDAPR